MFTTTESDTLHNAYLSMLMLNCFHIDAVGAVGLQTQGAAMLQNNTEIVNPSAPCDISTASTHHTTHTTADSNNSSSVVHTCSPPVAAIVCIHGSPPPLLPLAFYDSTAAPATASSGTTATPAECSTPSPTSSKGTATTDTNDDDATKVG
jgi:hypothetical protein